MTREPRTDGSPPAGPRRRAEPSGRARPSPPVDAGRISDPAREPSVVTNRAANQGARRWILPAILLLAFALRLIYVLQSRASPYFAEPQMDAGYHVEWARAFAEGRTFQPGPFFRAPLYPWFLGLCFEVFGEDYLAPRIVQVVLGTVGVGLVYLVGAHAFDRRVGWLAALFAATYWVLIYFDGELLLPVLEVPFDLLAIWLSLRVAAEPTPVRAGSAGLAWGLSAIVRPNVLLFVPLVAAWTAWIAWKRGPTLRRKLLAPTAFAAGLLAPILPITAYNAFVGGDRVLISSQGGVNLWIGNNPQSDGSSAIVPGTRADWWGGYHDAIQQAESALARKLKPSEVSRWYTEKAIDFVRQNPALALRQFVWKLRLFWTDWELGNNSDERFFAFRFGPLLRFLPLSFALLAALGAVGFLSSAKRAMQQFPLWGFVPVYMLGVVAFFVCSRFRVPILPVLAVFAAQACVWSVEAWQAKRFRSLGIVALTAGLVFLGVRHVPREIDQSESNGWWLLGVHEVQHENQAAGAEYFRRAIAAKPRNSYAQRDLGILLRDMGQFGEAEACLRSALAIRSDDPATWRGLIDLQLKQRLTAQALASARQAAQIAPYSATAQFDVGWVLLAESQSLVGRGAPAEEVDERRREAVAAFRAALALHPEPELAFECRLAAGRALTTLGRWNEAAEMLSSAASLRAQPDDRGAFWECHDLLIEALFRDGRAGDARAHLEGLKRRYPGEAQAQAISSKYAGK